MAKRQDPQAAASAIDRIASNRMGVEPQQQVAPAEQSAPAAPQALQAAPKPDTNQKKDTDQEKAQEQASPKTEGDKTRDDAVLFEVDFGEGNKRNFTPQQIKSMTERYSALNFKNQQYKPVMTVIENMRKQNPDLTPKQIADNLANMMNADGPSTFGRQSEQNGDAKQQGDKQGQQRQAEPEGRQGLQSNEELAASLKAWEEENAASLPPGYKEMLMSGNQSQQTMAQMTQQMQAMQKMLGQVLGQARGTADAARAGVEASEQNQSRAMIRTIQNNLDTLQQRMGLPDEAAEDFMAFAGERGYTFEDFIDPGLLGRVMQDFKAQMDGPEMERIRDIHKRRQAYTQSLGSAPSSGGPAPAAEGEGTLGRLTEKALSRKMI